MSSNELRTFHATQASHLNAATPAHLLQLNYACTLPCLLETQPCRSNFYPPPSPPTHPCLNSLLPSRGAIVQIKLLRLSHFLQTRTIFTFSSSTVQIKLVHFTSSHFFCPHQKSPKNRGGRRAAAPQSTEYLRHTCPRSSFIAAAASIPCPPRIRMRCIATSQPMG